MERGTARAAGLVIALGALCALPQGAAAADPQVTASAPWDCLEPRPRLTPTVPRGQTLLARLTVATNAPGDRLAWSGNAGEVVPGLQTGDVVWASRLVPVPSLGTGPQLTCADAPDATGTFELLTTPAAPATFSGAGPAFGGGASVVAFQALRGRHVADVRTTAGAVRVDGLDDASGPMDVAGSGTLELGDMFGSQRIRVAPLPGAVPAWSVTVRKLPVGISAFTPPGTLLKPGRTVRFRVTADGSTRARVVVLDAAGAVVRVLGESVAVNPGSGNGVAWNGLSASGVPARDGRYTVSWTTAEPGVAATTAQIDATVDGTPPTGRVLDRTLARRQPLVVRFRDALSRVRHPSIDRRPPLVSHISRNRDGLTLTVRAPRRGWLQGRNEIRVRASDAAGNVMTRTVVVRAR